MIAADVGEPQDFAISMPIGPLSLLIHPKFHSERRRDTNYQRFWAVSDKPVYVTDVLMRNLAQWSFPALRPNPLGLKRLGMQGSEPTSRIVTSAS